MSESNHRVLEIEVNNLKSKLEKHESEIGKLKDEVGELKTNAGEMKVYISQIFQMLDDIKTQVSLLRDLGTNTRQRSDNQWLDFFQRLFFLVLGGLIAYFFAKFK